MKGNEKLLEKLNGLLSEELTAVNQYMVHAEMDEDWSFDRLAETVEKRAIDEMKHAEKLIARILFLEGTPIVSNYKEIFIGASVEKQIDNDRQSEFEAIQSYNEGIKLACRRERPRHRSNCSRASSAMRKTTSIGWNPSRNRSNRSVSRTIWPSRSRTKNNI